MQTLNTAISPVSSQWPSIHFEVRGVFHLKCVVQDLYFHLGFGVWPQRGHVLRNSRWRRRPSWIFRDPLDRSFFIQFWCVLHVNVCFWVPGTHFWPSKCNMTSFIRVKAPLGDKTRNIQYFSINLGLSLLIKLIGTWKLVYKGLGACWNVFWYHFDDSIGLHDPNATERGLRRPREVAP